MNKKQNFNNLFNREIELQLKYRLQISPYEKDIIGFKIVNIIFKTLNCRKAKLAMTFYIWNTTQLNTRQSYVAVCPDCKKKS